MRTLRLKINDKVFDKVVWLLSKFGKEEVEVINEDTEFFKTQEYLERELKEIEMGNANFIEMEEAESRLENAIKRREDSI